MQVMAGGTSDYVCRHVSQTDLDSSLWSSTQEPFMLRMTPPLLRVHVLTNIAEKTTTTS